MATESKREILALHIEQSHDLEKETAECNKIQPARTDHAQGPKQEQNRAKRWGWEQSKILPDEDDAGNTKTGKQLSAP